MFNIGLDIGTSFVKVALTEINSGKAIDLISYPEKEQDIISIKNGWACLLYTSPSPRDATLSRMPSSA